MGGVECAQRGQSDVPEVRRQWSLIALITSPVLVSVGVLWITLSAHGINFPHTELRGADEACHARRGAVIINALASLGVKKYR